MSVSSALLMEGSDWAIWFWMGCCWTAALSVARSFDITLICCKIMLMSWMSWALYRYDSGLKVGYFLPLQVCQSTATTRLGMYEPTMKKNPSTSISMGGLTFIVD